MEKFVALFLQKKNVFVFTLLWNCCFICDIWWFVLFLANNFPIFSSSQKTTNLAVKQVVLGMILSVKI